MLNEITLVSSPKFSELHLFLKFNFKIKGIICTLLSSQGLWSANEMNTIRNKWFINERFRNVCKSAI